MDDKTKDAFKEMVMPLITGIGTTIAVGAITSALTKYLVTNFEEKDVTGDREVKPTDTETTVNKAEVSGNETEGKLAKDGVNGTEGKIKANETKGIASTAEATAADAGAQALRTKAGAMEVKTKGLEIQ
ncbi:MAG: hypothetical protein MJ250_01910 [Alphaproteobacteria bacterium]|nr:hypothetical protein [Alphaproteobacteria bacterium]